MRYAILSLTAGVSAIAGLALGVTLAPEHETTPQEALAIVIEELDRGGVSLADLAEARSAVDDAIAAD